jgi:hypothetical protein
LQRGQQRQKQRRNTEENSWQLLISSLLKPEETWRNCKGF